MRSALFVLCGLTALGCGAATSATNEKKGADKPFAAEVTVKVLSFDETKALLTSHKGKIVVVDCWSTT